MSRSYRPRGDKDFWSAAIDNKASFMQYYTRLVELATSMFRWVNLPDSVDERFLEMSLFTDGMAIFFNDDVLGYLALKTLISGNLDVYNIPIKRQAYSTTNYRKNLTNKDSVIIFNNYLHTNSMLDVKLFATRLADLDRAIDINAKAQKTPILLSCDEKTRLSLKNVYAQYDGNMPVINSYKGLNPESIKVLTTGAPFVADKLYQLKTDIWNEALTYLGISNVSFQKKERMVSDEVMRSLGGTLASRASRLEMRRQACKQINNMFGLNIWCEFREEYGNLDE